MAWWKQTMLLKLRSKMLIEEVASAVVDYFLRDVVEG